MHTNRRGEGCISSSNVIVSQKKSEQAEYHKLLVGRLKEQRERRSESLAKKRAIRQASVASKDAAE